MTLFKMSCGLKLSAAVAAAVWAAGSCPEAQGQAAPAAAAAVPLDVVVPAFSWDTVNTYIHCANMSGPWSDEALRKMKVQGPRFVVQERGTSRLWPPVNRSEESKMAAAARQVKTVVPGVAVFMYNPVFPIVDWYDYGRDVDENHPELEICWPNGTVMEWQVDTCTGCGGHHVGDFGKVGWQQRWAQGMVNTIKAGSVDGVFIDGFRGDVGDGNMAPPINPTRNDPAFAKAWGEGLKASMQMLRAGIGPKAVIIGNYGASITTLNGVGAMVERGGGGANDIKALQGYAAQGKYVEFHAQYADRTVATFNFTLAAFLCGAGSNAYYGAGGGWEYEGPDGCSSWLEDHAEYHKPLGEPVGEAMEGPSGVFTRKFKTGTHVRHEPGPNRSIPTKSCIWWSDGTTTGNAC